MPYYMGRIDRNYVEKANTRVNMAKPPIEYLRMLYFDSCVYDRAVLAHLVDKVGADRVVLGSDYPVGEMKPVEFVRDTAAMSRRATRADRVDAMPRRCLGCRTRRPGRRSNNNFTRAETHHGRTAVSIRSRPPSSSAAGRRCARSWRSARSTRWSCRTATTSCGGYVRWFTDTPLTDGYIPRSVIFPASDLMITVDMGGKGVRRKTRRPRRRLPRRRRAALHAGLCLGRLYPRIPGGDRRRRAQASRLSHHRLGRQRRHAAQIRRARRARA